MPRKKIASPRSKTCEMLKWNKDSPDGVCLRALIENSLITDMGPVKVRKQHAQFQKYAYGTFQSALNNIKQTHNNAIQRRNNVEGEDQGNLTNYFLFVH